MGTTLVISFVLAGMFVSSLLMFLMAQRQLEEVRIIRKDINEFRSSLIRIVKERKRQF